MSEMIAVNRSYQMQGLLFPINLMTSQLPVVAMHLSIQRPSAGTAHK